MANNCFYILRAVSDKKARLDRLVSIMKYEDPWFYIYRVFSAEADFECEEEDGLFSRVISGDVAWSARLWVHDEASFYNPKIDGQYKTLTELCKMLNIAVEIYTKETGLEFQEHYIVDNLGNILVSERANWSEEYADDDEDCLEPIGEWGGFEGWGDWTDDIFKERKE